ncbi:sugar phosphate isomerase/epimerase family protein, partial [Youngiibacter fragilis]
RCSRVLGFELDVHWIQRAGLDPIKVIKDYKGRVNIIHLKDYRIGNLDLSALKTGDMKKFFTDFQNIIEFAELGQGNLDLKGIIEAGLESGVEYFFVEQDDTYGKDPMESLKISRDHLVELGYEDLLKG